jgi:CRP/FNR family transcriptional regulator, cyclic AMP receptor protein
MNNQNVDSNLLLPILRRIPLFATLDENLHKEILGHIVLMYYPANHTLFKEGEDGDALYIIKTGQVQIFQPPREEGDLPQKIAEIVEGGFFGEMALVSDSPRNASAKTLMESEIFILSKDDFSQLIKDNPNLAEQISSAVISRLKQNDQNKK